MGRTVPLSETRVLHSGAALTPAAGGGEQARRSGGRRVSGVWAWRWAWVAVPRRELCITVPRQRAQRQSATQESQHLPELRTRRWAGWAQMRARTGTALPAPGLPPAGSPARPGGSPHQRPGGPASSQLWCPRYCCPPPGYNVSNRKAGDVFFKKTTVLENKDKNFFSKIIIEKSTLQ